MLEWDKQMHESSSEKSPEVSSTLLQTLKYLKTLRKFKVDKDDPERVKRGRLYFRNSVELRRLDLAEAIAIRSAPGAHEDPAHFSALAYAAASVGLAFVDLPLKEVEAQASKVLIGSVGDPVFFAKSQVLNGHNRILLSSALIDLILRLAEIADMLMTTRKRGVVSVSFLPEDAKVHPDRPLAITALYGLLVSYLYLGVVPRSDAAVDEVVSLPGRDLGAMALRWVIAHEWGHGVTSYLPDAVWAGRSEEFFADTHATVMTCYSASSLEGLPPEIGVAGGAFSLACHDILVRAISVARSGSEVPDKGDASHPPSTERALVALEMLHKTLDFSSGPAGIDVRIKNEDEQRKPVTISGTERNRVLGPAQITFDLWNEVRPLLERNRANLKVHRDII